MLLEDKVWLCYSAWLIEIQNNHALLDSSMNRHLLRVLVIEIFIIAILYPYRATYSPSTNVMRGPLWLLRAYTTADVVFGIVLILICMFMLGLYLIHPTLRRFPWFIAAIVLWIGVGIFASFVDAQ